MEKNVRSFAVEQKVKLKLSQPRIMCSGRAVVECYYRGRVRTVSLDGKRASIYFKYDGIHAEYPYDCEKQEFIDNELKDIIIL